MMRQKEKAGNSNLTNFIPLPANSAGSVLAEVSCIWRECASAFVASLAWLATGCPSKASLGPAGRQLLVNAHRPHRAAMPSQPLALDTQCGVPSPAPAADAPFTDSALAGVPTAVAALVSALCLQDQPWASVAGALVDLLRRHAAGLTAAIARDELDAAFRVSARDAPRAWAAAGLDEASAWEGIVYAMQKAPRPPAWVLRASNERQTVFGMFVGEPAAAFGSHGLRVKAWPAGGIARDVSGRAPVEMIEEERARAVKGKGNFCQAGSLLPGCAAVLELKLASNADGPGVEFPDRASSLLRERTLQAVWTERCTNPAWVSARIVDVAPDALRLLDIDVADNDQPTVVLTLAGQQTGYAHLLAVGDVILLHAPTVTPAMVSFDLSFGENTVVFAKKRDEAAATVDTAKKELKVLKPPPLKRQRVHGAKDSLGFAVETGDAEEILAERKSPVTLEHLVALRNPCRQPRFDMLTVVGSSPRIPGMTQSEAGVPCTLCLTDRVNVEFASNLSDEVRQVVPGHVLWLRGLRALVEPGQWECTAFTNVSMLPGAICSPFMRNVVAVSVLTSETTMRPGTVHIDIVIDSASADNESLCVNLRVSNYCSGIGLGRGSASVVVRNSLVLSHLLGTSMSEFWFGSVNAHVRSKRLSAIVGFRYRFSVAMSNDRDDAFVNECAALSRVHGTEKHG